MMRHRISAFTAISCTLAFSIATRQSASADVLLCGNGTGAPALVWPNGHVWRKGDIARTTKSTTATSLVDCRLDGDTVVALSKDNVVYRFIASGLWLTERVEKYGAAKFVGPRGPGSRKGSTSVMKDGKLIVAANFSPTWKIDGAKVSFYLPSGSLLQTVKRPAGTIQASVESDYLLVLALAGRNSLVLIDSTSAKNLVVTDLPASPTSVKHIAFGKDRANKRANAQIWITGTDDTLWMLDMTNNSPAWESIPVPAR